MEFLACDVDVAARFLLDYSVLACLSVTMKIQVPKVNNLRLRCCAKDSSTAALIRSIQRQWQDDPLIETEPELIEL